MEFLLPYLPFLIPILVIIVILLLGYVKAPPDQAYIISGLRKNSRICNLQLIFPALINKALPSPVHKIIPELFMQRPVMLRRLLMYVSLYF